VSASAEVKSAATSLNTSVSDLKVSNESLRTTVATAQADAKKAEETGQQPSSTRGFHYAGRFPGGGDSVAYPRSEC